MAKGNRGNKGNGSTEPNKPTGTPDGEDGFEPTVTPESVEIDLGPVGLEANSDGTVGVSVELPVPGLPGVTASGGITFDPTTGEIVETEFGAELGPVVSINVAIAGCEIMTTITIGIPNTPLSISYTIPGTMPNCEIEEEGEDEPPESPETLPPPDEYDPPMPPPDNTSDEWVLLTMNYVYNITDYEYKRLPPSTEKNYSTTPKNRTLTNYDPIKLWVKAPLNLTQLTKVEKSTFRSAATGEITGISVTNRIAICCSGEAQVGFDGARRNPQVYSYRKRYLQYYFPYNSTRVNLGTWSYQNPAYNGTEYEGQYDYIPFRPVLVTNTANYSLSINGITPDKPTRPSLPPAPPPELIMDKCCAASTRMLREIYEVLDPQAIKKTEIPKSFCYPGATGTIKMQTYDKILEAIMLQANLYGFQPFQAKVADANAGKEGSQPIAVAFNSLSGNLKFQTELGIENAGDIDTLTNICVRLAQTLCIMQKATLESYRRLEAIEEFLDFDIKQVLEDVPMMFDPRAGLLAEKGFGKKPGAKEENTEINTEKELARFLQSSNMKTKVINNVDKRTLRKIIYEIRNVLMANNTGSEVG